MQLRFDSNYYVTEESVNLIKSNNGTVIDPKTLRGRDGRELFAVGDFTCKVLEELDILPEMEIYDLKTQRGKGIYKGREGSVRVKNPPGVVTGNLIKLIYTGIHSEKRFLIEVDGEEDLAVLPIIFYAPIHSLVVYGIPDVGMAQIEVNDLSKKLVENIFEKMEVKME